MGIPVLILGKSGSGKSTSMRNFNGDEVGIFNIAKKPLPFRNVNGLRLSQKPTYNLIEKKLISNKLKTYVIDDSQYLLVFDLFDKAKIKGFEKFSDMAIAFYNLIKTIIERTSDDTIVYFLHHTELTDDGVKAKTIGKMLDDKLTVEGLFSIVLGCAYTEGGYKFITHTSGADTFKTPIGMFEDKLIDNDLKAVDEIIRQYYGFKEDLTNEKTE